MDRRNPLLAGSAAFAGRYELLSELGMGGFGAVYKARQLTTGQAVALKIMRLPEQGGAAEIERRIARFLREAQLCAQLHHPNIVQLIDAGRAEDDLLYTVFSFVPGETLADVLAREGALSPREARHLMLQVLDALAYAHAQGVIHRDLKPRNIMVLPSGARRNAVVLDFGIGAISGAGGERRSRLTGTDEALGTVGYAAPEQLRGSEPTPRVDLFSWGLVYLECLTGAPVFAGSSSAEILYAQLSPDPVPIPLALDGHWLGGLLRHVTNKDPAARDARAAALVAALEACDLGELSQETMAGGAPSLAGADLRSRPVHGFFASTAVARPGATAEGGERRQITVVCCAIEVLAGATGAIEVEEADEVLRAGLARCAEIARGFRGHVAAALGDRVLIYFGYPRAEEDDARRAARAALAIAAAMQAEGERAAARGARIVARLGIHTGVLVAQELRAVAGLNVGATPGTAARLAARAPAGGVAVSAEAQRKLRSAFELEREGPRRAGDDGAASEIFLLRAERGSRLTPDADSRGAPLFGREQEMAILLERWRRARAGAGQSTLVTGEPGIGKSRLARELRARLANEPHTFLEFRCAPDARHNALLPVVDMLGRALGLDQEPSPERRITRLEARLSGYEFTPLEVMPLFLPLFSLPMSPPYARLDVSPQRLKERTLNAVLSLLFAMAEERPLILVAEDLHWSDATTLELLTLLVQEAPSAPVSVIMTARPEFSPPFSTTGVQQIPLSRLERAHMEAMVASLLGGKSLPAEVIEQVVERTDGVPLFVEELTQMMVDSGVLLEREDRYELARPLSQAEIPSTLRDLLTARLDNLGRVKETAQLAAALGREFPVEVLSAVSHLGAEGVQQDLDRLMEAGLVQRKRRPRNPVYGFKHALIRDAAYESLSRAARRKVHAHIARTLEERFPEIVEARPDMIMQHHAAAEQKLQALTYARKAALGALVQSNYAEAIGHATDALGWLEAIEEERERADLELGLNGVITPALMSTRGWADPEIKAKVERSLALVEVVGHSAYSMPALWALVLFYHVGGHDRGKAVETAGRMLDLAKLGNDVGQQVAALAALGHCSWIDGNYERARAHWESVIALYDPEAHRDHPSIYGHDSKAWACMGLGEALWFMGYPEEALAQAEAAVAWAKETGHANTLAQAYMFLSLLRHDRQEPAEVIKAATIVQELEKRYGLPPVSAYTGVVHGWALGDLGMAKRHLQNLEGSGHALAQTYFRAVVARMEAAHGDLDAALGRVEGCIALCEATGERYYLAELLRLQGAFLLERDPRAEDASAACFRRAVELARAQGVKMLELAATTSLARVLLRQGAAEEARALLSPIVAWFGEAPDVPPLTEARALLTSLTELA
ncbi:TOMM system kinase/cyclase fusion protein [Sorangium sp. So ce131]|uniref:TOMM system kinase/cyclase fusion protein n=1 Tax=Sorangium sp. So ce131 TaxID=3133282 RepID=UPI003F640D9C